MNSWYHAQRSARKWGGIAEDYIQIHEFIDHSKQAIGDVRHRALLHSTWGIWVVQQVFGRTVEIVKNRGTIEVPVRLVAEQHILDDLGRIPSPADYFEHMALAPWMSGPVDRVMSTNDIFNENEETRD